MKFPSSLGMRNLENYDLQRKPIIGLHENITHVASTEDIIFVLRNGYLQAYEFKTGENVFASSMKYECVTSLEVLTLNQRLWFGTGNGFIFLDLIPDNYSLEFVSSFNFSAAVWNPTQDILAIISSDGKIGVYALAERLTCVAKCDLQSSEIEKPFASVGWGSEKTQFQGSKEKFVKNEVHAEMECVTDDIRTRISWRGNGEHFAVNYYDKQKHVRTIKVFKYPCVLAHQIEETHGLQSVIAWKPVGNCIASAAYNSNIELSVVFYEKNCLPRSDHIKLRDNVYIEDINWSPTGEVLAVHQKIENVSVISLYIKRNFAWYLKQQLPFEYVNPVISCYWTESDGSLFNFCVNTLRESLIYSFIYVVSRSSTIRSENVAICAVIDGGRLLLTYFTENILPPPLHSFELNFTKVINFVIFQPGKQRFVAIDTDNEIFVYSYTLSEINLEGSFQIEIHEPAHIPLTCHHFVFKEDNVVCLVREEEPDFDAVYGQMCVFSLEEDPEKWDQLDMNVENNITCMTVVENSDSFPLVRQRGNKLVLFELDNEIEEIILCYLPAPAIQISAMMIENTTFVFALSTGNRFFINNVQISNAVISFIIHEAYLIVTTVQKNLVGIRLNLFTLNKVSKARSFENNYSRMLQEQGVWLISGIAKSSYVIMQLPRGSLETVACHVIGIDAVENILQHGHWAEALDRMNIDKLNLNLLIDLNPRRFLKNVDKCIKEVGSEYLLSMLLLGLKSCNVLQTEYRYCVEAPFRLNNKIEQICQAILNFVKSVDFVNYLNILVICHVLRNDSQGIYESLRHITIVWERATRDPSLTEKAANGLKYLFMVATESEVYKTALLTYNLNFALFVAKNSQMDPKEYIPFINNLQGLEDTMRRFKINDYLKNYSTAVLYMLSSPCSMDEVTSYIQEKGVYKEAYESSVHDNQKHITVTALYANHLSEIKKHADAGALYAQIKDWHKAFDEYVCGLRWHEALFVIKKQLDLSERTKMIKLASLAKKLADAGHIEEAVIVYDEYMDIFDIPVDLLMEVHNFREAYRIAQKHCRPDLIENVIRPQVFDHLSGLCETIESLSTNFEKHKTRLLLLREEKLKKLRSSISSTDDDALEVAESTEVLCSDVDSLFSQASGTTRSSSSVSSRSSKKDELKRIDLREGGQYEDIALLRHLYLLIKEVFEMGPEIGDFIFFMHNFETTQLDTLEKVHNLLLKLQNSILQSIKVIWPLNLYVGDGRHGLEARSLCENITLLEPLYHYPPKNLTTDWTVSFLKKNL